MVVMFVIRRTSTKIAGRLSNEGQVHMRRSVDRFMLRGVLRLASENGVILSYGSEGFAS